MPRIGKRQKYRTNTPASTPKEYYHRTVTVPFIDHLLSELSNRFDQSKDKAACGLALIPSIMAADPEFSTKILQYAQLVQKDLPCPTHVSSEIQCWRKKWEAWSDKRPTTLSATLQHSSPTFYPNITTMLKLMATLPITSCEWERSFSRLRTLKTYLRSTMTQERLSGLALMCIHRDIQIDRESVISRFSRMHPHRMEMVDVLK